MDSSSAGAPCILQNCLSVNGTLELARSATQTPSWTIQDGAFDHTATLFYDGQNANPAYTFFDYNAFLTNQARLETNGANDVVVTNFAWEVGPLGNYYQPSNSPLINVGGRTANLVGLYHYTVTTNLVSGLEVKETNSVIDIGYHFVAVDSHGVPIDTNGDGIPDYLEDANGNGTVDSGEIGWNIIGDLGLKVIITRPKSNSVLP